MSDDNLQQQAATIIHVDDFSIERVLREAFDKGLLSSDINLNMDSGSKASHNKPTTHPTSNITLRPRLRQNLHSSLKRKTIGDEDKDVAAIQHANVACKRINVDIDASDLKSTPSPWRGSNHTQREKCMDGTTPLSLEALRIVHPDFEVIPWNGKSPIKIADNEGRIIAHLGGKPNGKSFRRSMRKLETEIHAARIAHNIPPKLTPEQCGNRGDHPAGSYGYTYPSSTSRPCLLRNGEYNSHRAALSLTHSHAAQRLKHIQGGMMKAAAPRMFALYCDTDRIVRQTTTGLDDELREYIPSIDPPGVYPFASTTYNFGPHTQCRRHRDCMNFPCGWCAITSMGTYNPKYGGHLILWEVGLIVEFPPHATVLIPSALLTHSNTSIRNEETRMSVVRYSAGGLFMWVANGCQPKSTATTCDSVSTFRDYLSLFMTLDELEEQQSMF